MTDLLAAIVGTGNQAAYHARAVAGLAGIELVACCDIEVGKATQYAERFGLPLTPSSTLPAYKTIPELLTPARY